MAMPPDWEQEHLHQMEQWLAGGLAAPWLPSSLHWLKRHVTFHDTGSVFLIPSWVLLKNFFTYTCKTST